MKKAGYAILLCCSLLFTPLCVKADIADVQKHAGYISLTDSKTKEVEPNLAKISFAIENTSSDAQKATAENNEISSKIIESLKKIATTDTDTIKTTNFSVRPVYATTTSGKRVIKNYTAVNSITVETKDTKKVGKFIDKAISSGANRTESLSYSYENDKSVCQELYPVLIKELKTQANTIAQAAGTTVDGIKQINVSCSTDFAVSNGRFYNSAKLAMGATAEDDSALETPVEPGKVKIRVYVNADFYVK